MTFGSVVKPAGRFVVWVLSGIGMLAVAYAQPEPYPNRPIRMIVPTVAGSPVDVLARCPAIASRRRLGSRW
jgi:tripartite-type tricarboxylate transporter receptor subunit TctC